MSKWLWFSSLYAWVKVYPSGRVALIVEDVLGTTHYVYAAQVGKRHNTLFSLRGAKCWCNRADKEQGQ